MVPLFIYLDPLIFFLQCFAIFSTDHTSIVLHLCLNIASLMLLSGVFCHFSFIFSIANSRRSLFFPPPASVWTWCSDQLFSHSSECLPLPGAGCLCQNTSGPRRETPQVSRSCGARGSQGKTSVSFSFSGKSQEASVCKDTNLSHLQSWYLWSLVCLTCDLT